MKTKIGAIFLTLMMVISLLPFTAINVEAQGTELIINDSQTGNDLHQFNFKGNWKVSTGYPDRFYGGDEHWYNFNSCYTEGDDLPSYEIKFKVLGLNYTVKNNQV